MGLSDDFEREISTEIATSDAHNIWVRGHHLADDLMGAIDLGSMLFLVVQGRRPTPAEARLFNGVLVSIVDYGLSPMAIIARLAHTGAPEALQGPIAAGLLGVGSRFVGVWEEVGRMLASDAPGTEERAPEHVALDVLHSYRGRAVPGLGHPFYKVRDPRATRIFEIATEEGLLGPRAELMSAIAAQTEHVFGRHLVLNHAGASGAVLLDLGFQPEVLRGFAVVARAAGLVGHLSEEIQTPIGPAMWDNIRRAAGSDGTATTT